YLDLHAFRLTLAEIRTLPARPQITRHDCVECWNAICKWTGIPLADLLTRAKLRPDARFVMFHCAHTMPLRGDNDGEDDGATDDSGSQEEAPAGNANPNMAKQSGGGESKKDS
ncbi:molybdopterin-dependent oxidoreductase, partial [Methylobacterium sp. J-026]|uniref:molybdopterin-dependent oxidoreductase n=1 Tax=Methylobacterium sp. J-026 TaxID=2836624 RepID=UPI001FB9B975